MNSNFKDLISTLTRITGRKYPEFEKILNKAIDEVNIPLLTEFSHLIEDIEKVITFDKEDQKIRVKNKKQYELYQKYRDLQNLAHLMVISESGIAIYNYSFAEKYFDPQLISGFLTAILSFQGSSMIKDNTQYESGFELSYANFIILLNTGKKVKVALILDRKPSNSLRLSLSDFISSFENRYKNELDNFRGDMKLFNKTSDLVEEVFKVSLIWPYRIRSDVDIKSSERYLNSLQNLIINTAYNLQEDINYFLISNIVENIKKQKNLPEEKIISAFYELKQQNFFITFPIEKLDEIIEKEKEKERIEKLAISLDENEIISSIEGVPKKIIDRINNHLNETSYLFQKLIIEDLIKLSKKEKAKYLKEKNNEWTELKKKKDLIYNTLKNITDEKKNYEIITNLLQYKDVCEKLGYEDEANQNADKIKEYMKDLKELNPIKYQILMDDFKQTLNKYIEKAEFEIAKEKYLTGAFLYKKAKRVATQICNEKIIKSISKILSDIEK